MFLAMFIAMGSIGFGLSQIVFCTVYNNLDHHTEILFIPVTILWVFVWLRCRPAEVPHSERKSVIGSLHSLRPVVGKILVLFLILAISSGVLTGLFSSCRNLPKRKVIRPGSGRAGLSA